MRTLALAFMVSIIPLMADFYPPTVVSSIANIKKNTVTLTKPFPAKGMSGIVMHSYRDDLQGITGYIAYEGGTKATLFENEPILHNELPSVKSKIRRNNKVIGGYLYKNILLLAPDANTYARIIASAKKNWIHPDLFAMFLAQEGDQYPNKKNLKKFANEYQIGLIYIVRRGKAMLYDPLSQRYVSQKALTGLPKKGQFPFYTRLGKIEAGWLSKSVTGEYYKMIANIR